MKFGSMPVRCFVCCAAVFATTAVTNAEPPIVTFSVTTPYLASFEGQISIRNPASNPPILNWQLQFSWPVAITSVWGCTSPALSSPYVLTHTNLVTNIDSGSLVTIGFMAAGVLEQTVTNCTVNGIAAEVRYGGPVSTVQVGGLAEDASSFDIAQGATTKSLSLLSGAAGLIWTALSNNPSVCKVAVTGNQLTLTGVTQGLAGIRVEEASTGSVRNIGVAVRHASGAFPGIPRHFAFGTNGEDRDNQLTYFRNFGTLLQNRRVDVRYMYLNGGPINGWASATATMPEGARARNYLRNSKGLGFIPCFVFYNIPHYDENFNIDSINLTTADYMSAYYKNLMLFLRICKEETPEGWPVMINFEPDSLGYMSLHGVSPTGGGWPASGGNPVQVATAYTTEWSGQPILQQGTDPAFANTLQGFVQSVNYITRRELPNAHFGWQFNLWASRGVMGYVVQPPGRGLMHLTDTSCFARA